MPRCFLGSELRGGRMQPRRTRFSGLKRAKGLARKATASGCAGGIGSRSLGVRRLDSWMKRSLVAGRCTTPDLFVRCDADQGRLTDRCGCDPPSPGKETGPTPCCMAPGESLYERLGTRAICCLGRSGRTSWWYVQLFSKRFFSSNTACPADCDTRDARQCASTSTNAYYQSPSPVVRPNSGVPACLFSGRFGQRLERLAVAIA